MGNKLHFLFIFFCFCFNPLLAQDPVTFSGRVIDDGGATLSDVKVSINGSDFKLTDNKGSFEFTLVDPDLGITAVLAEKSGYEKSEWRWSSASEVEITMNKLVHFEGQVLGLEQKPIKFAQVKVQTNSLHLKATTDSSGYFHIYPPRNTKIDHVTDFYVNGLKVGPTDLIFSADDYFVQINNQKSAKEQLPEPEPEKVDPSKNDALDVKPFAVTVLLEDETPAVNVPVLVGDVEYVTDKTGSFLVNDQAISQKDVRLKGYVTITTSFDEANNDLVIYVEKAKNKSEDYPLFDTEVEDDVVSEIRGDFNIVLRELEIKKQNLSETSIRIQKEMERVAKKLTTEEKGLTDEQQKILQADLEQLEDALIKTELEYQDAQLETGKVLTQMKTTLKAKDTKIEEIESKTQKEIIVLVSTVLILLVLASISYFIAKRLRRQKKEVELSYRNIQIISDIGKKITATLDFENLIQTLHANVNNLLDATVFGIGIVNEGVNKIEFKKYIEKGETQSYFFESLDDQNKFSVWCLRNQREVIINDLGSEYSKFIDKSSLNPTEAMPQSLIYLPLVFEGKAIGVITVQSYKKDAYKALDSTILQTLASYVSVALSNANAFEIVKETNKNITNSIRYAKTIQEAILPSEIEMADYLGEHFIIYRPKDIVSGDFYWFAKQLDEHGVLQKSYIAVVDCTGHGVPGAFMSMIGKTLLDEIVNQLKITDTAQILEQLNISVKKALKQEDNINDDGMDVCLCSIEKTAGGTNVEFTGAKRPLYYYTKESGKIESIKGDSKTIGGIQRKKRQFHKEQLSLSKGDCIYLTTDGMVDQSNLEREKFGTKRFLDLLGKIAPLHVPEQERMLESELNKHQNSAEQRDDILIMGIQV
ncbi:MAG: serine phosphatase RsbU (regulator of sigma subunit) [Arenicella sp.]|jgi:serine phosphatase RsbU (regulator of sigma subunit)